MTGGYSVENARRFAWSSVTGELHSERVSHLERYLVGDSVLDAGCGGGAYAELLTRQGFRVTGLDFHRDFLEIAGDRLGGALVQGDITALGFADDAFDCSYCYDVLEHVDDRQAIRELARVTSRRLILAVPREDDIMHRFGLTFFHYQDQTHLRNYTETSLHELVSVVRPAQVRIFRELPVPAAALVRALLDIDAAPPLVRRGYSAVMSRLITRMPFRAVHTGLVAVVDLQ